MRGLPEARLFTATHRRRTDAVSHPIYCLSSRPYARRGGYLFDGQGTKLPPLHSPLLLGAQSHYKAAAVLSGLLASLLRVGFEGFDS